MKKKVLTILSIGTIFLSCSKSEKKHISDCVTESKSLTNSTGSSDSLKTEKGKVQQKVNETKSDINHIADKAKEKIDTVEAKITNNASEIKKDVKDLTKKGAEKVEEEVKNVKENL